MAATSGFKVRAGLVGKLFGNAVSSAVGFGAGVAMAPVLAPAVRDIANTVNSKYSFVFPEPGELAHGVATGHIDKPTAGRWASYHGVGPAAFDALILIAESGPGVPVAFDLWRRGVIQEADFRLACQRDGLEPKWIDDLVAVKLAVLDEADLARAIHRGLIPDPGLLQGEKPGSDRHVPAYPVYPIDALKEALANGYDRNHLGTLVGLQGLPMGSHEAAQALFRGVITHDDYLAAIAEGNTRNEWAGAIMEQSRTIPTVHDYVENYIRGYSKDTDMVAGAARHGMTQTDAELLFQNAGRPLPIHQITTGLARGGVFHPEPNEQTDPYEASVRESNIKPSYYDIAIANKYVYPAAFVLRGMAQTGDLTEAETHQILLYEGWEPNLAAKVASRWAAPSGSSSKEATAADLLTLYDGGKASRAETLTALEGLGYPATVAATKLDVVDARKVAGAKANAIGDLHTAYKKGVLPDANVATALGELGVAAWAVPLIVAAWRTFLEAEGGHPPASLPTPP